jgi:hypothetical protein
MTPEQLADQQFWQTLLILSFIALAVILIIPTKKLDEDGEEIDLDDERALERRRRDMDCYGRHEWIVNTEGLRRCKKCDYEYSEED